MKVIVTGGAGAIGRYVVEELLAAGDEPIVVDRRAPVEADARVGVVQCDLTDLEATVAAVRDADAVFHMAAIPNPYSDPGKRY